MLATGIPSTIALASTLGAVTRVLLILCSLILVASSLRSTVWWRPLAIWSSLASLTETFLSLFLLIHAGQSALLSAYGANPPTAGTIIYPAKVIGTDLNTYTSPSLSASFNPDFYLGLISLAIVGSGTIIKMLQEREVFASSLPGVRGLFLTPPYRHVWLSTNDKDLNPLGQDPENTTDDQLLESFRRIYDTILPGGSVSIVLPSSAATTSERFQKLLTWTGFSIEDAETIYRTPDKAEIQLRFKKPVLPRESVVTEPEPMQTPPAGASPEQPLAEAPLELAIPSGLDWTPTKMSRLERAMLRSAVSILSKQNEPVPYRELLNQVYMELVEKKVQFDSAREIESTLLKHVGLELALTEEADKEGFKTVKRWTLGEEPLSPARDGRSFFQRMSSHRPRAPSVARLLKKWQRKPKYRPRPEPEE